MNTVTLQGVRITNFADPLPWWGQSLNISTNRAAFCDFYISHPFFQMGLYSKSTCKGCTVTRSQQINMRSSNKITSPIMLLWRVYSSFFHTIINDYFINRPRYQLIKWRFFWLTDNVVMPHLNWAHIETNPTLVFKTFQNKSLKAIGLGCFNMD